MPSAGELGVIETSKHCQGPLQKVVPRQELFVPGGLDLGAEFHIDTHLEHSDLLVLV